MHTHDGLFDGQLRRVEHHDRVALGTVRRAVLVVLLAIRVRVELCPLLNLEVPHAVARPLLADVVGGTARDVLEASGLVVRVERQRVGPVDALEVDHALAGHAAEGVVDGPVLHQQDHEVLDLRRASKEEDARGQFVLLHESPRAAGHTGRARTFVSPFGRMFISGVAEARPSVATSVATLFIICSPCSGTVSGRGTVVRGGLPRFCLRLLRSIDLNNTLALD